MIKSNKGLTLVSLLITIAIMLIITSVTVSVSYDRFEINNLNKMLNDLEFLRDKVSNYYLRYGGLPIVRDSDNNPVIYNYKELEFESNVNDNENYYIIDLEAMEGITLNYGKEGYENPNTSDDVYIINEKSHNIYYPRGIEWDGDKYYSIADTNDITDTIPPSKPEIKIISGEQNEEGIYTTEVAIEIIPGKDSYSRIEKTTYSINDAAEKEITTLPNNVLTIADNGTYNIKVRSYDRSGNISDNTQIITIQIEYNLPGEYQRLEYIESTGTQYIDTGMKLNQDSTLEINLEITEVGDYNVFGSRSSASENNFGIIFSKTYDQVDLDFGDYTKNRLLLSYNIDRKIYKMSNKQLQAGDITQDVIDYIDFSTPENAYIFNMSGNYPTVNNPAKMRLFYCKILDKDALVRNYIPCKRISDGVVGLYDIVNNVFYKNADTSSDNFIAGPEV